MGSFLVCEQRRAGIAWTIVSWSADDHEAIRVARLLVAPPFLSAATCVLEIGGVEPAPRLTVQFAATR